MRFLNGKLLVGIMCLLTMQSHVNAMRAGLRQRSSDTELAELLCQHRAALARHCAEPTTLDCDHVVGILTSCLAHLNSTGHPNLLVLITDTLNVRLAGESLSVFYCDDVQATLREHFDALMAYLAGFLSAAEQASTPVGLLLHELRLLQYLAMLDAPRTAQWFGATVEALCMSRELPQDGCAPVLARLQSSLTAAQEEEVIIETTAVAEEICTLCTKPLAPEHATPFLCPAGHTFHPLCMLSHLRHVHFLCPTCKHPTNIFDRLEQFNGEVFIAEDELHTLMLHAMPNPHTRDYFLLHLNRLLREPQNTDQLNILAHCAKDAVYQISRLLLEAQDFLDVQTLPKFFINLLAWAAAAPDQHDTAYALSTVIDACAGELLAQQQTECRQMLGLCILFEASLQLPKLANPRTPEFAHLKSQLWQNPSCILTLINNVFQPHGQSCRPLGTDILAALAGYVLKYCGQDIHDAQVTQTSLALVTDLLTSMLAQGTQAPRPLWLTAKSFGRMAKHQLALIPNELMTFVLERASLLINPEDRSEAGAITALNGFIALAALIGARPQLASATINDLLARALALRDELCNPQDHSPDLLNPALSGDLHRAIMRFIRKANKKLVSVINPPLQKAIDSIIGETAG